MDTRDQLSKARELIQARRYDEARALLKRIDHPKAKEWLAKLNESAPKSSQSGRKKPRKKSGMRVYLLALVLIVLVAAGALLALDQSASDDEEPETDQAAVPEPTSEAATEGVSFDDMQPGSGEIDITGDYSAAGEAEFSFVTEPSGMFAPRQIVIRVDVESSDSAEPPGRLELFLPVPDDPPGTYPLVDVLPEFSDSWGVVHRIMNRDSWISPEKLEAIAIEGSITVVENGDSFTGSFEFITSSATDERTMTVSGRVNQLAFTEG